MKKILTCILAVTTLFGTSLRLCADDGVESLVFTRVNVSGDTANRHVQHVLQADDGRMVITSFGYVDIYDGARFRHIPTDDSLQTELKDCNTPYTVYSDNHDRLWFKRWFGGRCLNLKSERYIQPLDSLFRHHGIGGEVTDFYCDQEREMWVLTDGFVTNLDEPSRRIRVERAWGNITNLQTAGGRLYLFFHPGVVRMYDMRTLKFLSTTQFLTGKDYNVFDLQCHVVQHSDSLMYVCCSGQDKGIVLMCDTRTGQWTELLRTATVLHGARACDAHHIMVACPDCVYTVDTRDNGITRLDRFNLQGVWFPFKHFSWIYTDVQGGTWLGSYSDGLFYAHPLREQTYSADGNVAATGKTVSPLHLTIAGVSIAGSRLAIGNPHLPEAEKYVREYDLGYDENSITFEISALNYALPSNTTYRYMLLEEDADLETGIWHDATPDNYLVDANGLLVLPLQNLAPGRYRLTVSASCGDGHDSMTIRLHVHAPWWDTPYARVAYVLLTLAVLLLVTWLSDRYHRRRIQRRHQEEMLLMQVRNLIDRCNEYEKLYANMSAAGCQQEQDTKNEEAALSDTDRAFIHRAIRLVEENMSTGNYTVEQLSRDMCMERTGLYKKMTAMVEQTPSAFIRSIRLQKAMDMLQSGNYTVSEVAQRTGFSTTSYFCKVFTAEYGEGPAECQKKSGE